YKKRLQRTEREKGPSHTRTLSIIRSLKYVNMFLGKFDQAVSQFERLEASKEQKKHGAHEQALHAFTERGVICYRRQCYEDARAILTQAVITAEKELGTSHWITMYAAESLATCYGFMGNLSETEAWHRRAIAWMEQAYGITHPILANSLMLLRYMYIYAGRSSDGLARLARALQMQTKQLGALHHNTLETKAYIGMQYCLQNKPEKALQFLESTAEQVQKVLIPSHVQVLETNHALGMTYILLGRYSEAKKLLSKALTGFISTLGYEDRSTLA
ncbi:TPR-like protein, partial [Piedraia hortae CBS 480.64]